MPLDPDDLGARTCAAFAAWEAQRDRCEAIKAAMGTEADKAALRGFEDIHDFKELACDLRDAEEKEASLRNAYVRLRDAWIKE